MINLKYVRSSREEVLDSLAEKLRLGVRPFWENPNAHRLRFVRWFSEELDLPEPKADSGSQVLFFTSYSERPFVWNR